MTDLQRAIRHLSAVRVSRTEWIYQEILGADHYVVDSAGMRDLGRALARSNQDDDIYSLWCSRTLSRSATRAERERAGSW